MLCQKNITIKMLKFVKMGIYVTLILMRIQKRPNSFAQCAVNQLYKNVRIAMHQFEEDYTLKYQNIVMEGIMIYMMVDK